MKGSIVRGVVSWLAWPPLAFWRAYALTVLWHWFAVPLGAHDIGKAHAYGLVALVSLLTFQPKLLVKGQEHDFDSWKAIFVMAFAGSAAPAFALLAGWIAHSLMGGG